MKYAVIDNKYHIYSFFSNWHDALYAIYNECLGLEFDYGLDASAKAIRKWSTLDHTQVEQLRDNAHPFCPDVLIGYWSDEKINQAIEDKNLQKIKEDCYIGYTAY